MRGFMDRPAQRAPAISAMCLTLIDRQIVQVGNHFDHGTTSSATDRVNEEVHGAAEDVPRRGGDLLETGDDEQHHGVAP